ncbi:fibronectin type III domain-containing protein [Candidatus Microgenomates bacterium]|nr:fibronectin type III domain-containing protein [Candidatus Microgenomates bacterium]
MNRRLRLLLSYSVSILALISLSALRPPTVAADCGGPYPPAPAKVSAVSGPGGGEVTLYWDTSAYANRYAVAYGTQSGKYVYGADNIGGEKTRSSTIKSLSSGTRYYFRLAAANGCASSPFSVEVSAVAAGGGAVVSQPVSQAPVGGPSVSEVKAPVQPMVSSKLSAYSGPGVGNVTLSWPSMDGADNYHLVYGTQAGKYLYGALNIGKINKFTVQKLNPGSTYYFALVPVSGGRAMYTTAPVSARAYVLVTEIVETTREALVQPQPMVTQPPQPPPSEIFAPSPTEAVVQPVTEVPPGTEGIPGDTTVPPVQ